MSTKHLEGKVAVVTGCAHGIGKGIAKLFATEGAKVVVNDIATETDGSHAADKVVKEINEANGTAISNYDSVATMAGGASIIKSAIDNFGKIDILVNNAGNFFVTPTLEMKEEQWDSIVAVHLKGHFACIKATLPHMVKQKSGRIINISSRAAFFHKQNLAYATVKAGILGLTAMLAEEMKEHNITVNAILPSATTSLFPWDKSPSGDNIPFYKNVDPESIAPIVAYLATDKAAKITSRFIYAAAGDLCLYSYPMKLSAAHAFVRKIGTWTLDELDEAVAPLLGFN